MRAGRPADEPAAIVRRCGWPDQATIRCTLATVADRLEERRMRPPVVVIVGAVADLSPALDWFTRRPLFGQRILVTRPVDQAAALGDPLAELGADAWRQPAIEIGQPADWSPVDAALEGLGEYDWLVFSSANGVRYLLDRLWNSAGDLRRLAGVKIAAVGPGTADELARYHLKADLTPEEYRAEALAAALTPEAQGNRFLLARASRGREVLHDQLTRAGGRVDQIVVYSSTDVAVADEAVAAEISAGRIDWVTVTSSAIARSLVRLFGEDLRRAKLASISPVTTATLGKLGHQPAVEASTYTMAGLVDAICRFNE